MLSLISYWCKQFFINIFFFSRHFQYGRQNIENFRNSTRINFNISGSSENELLPTSEQHQDDYDPNAKEQTVTQNGKCGAGNLPQANGNGLSGNTVISRDTFILLPEGEPGTNGKIKEPTTNTNEIKENLQVCVYSNYILTLHANNMIFDVSFN